LKKKKVSTEQFDNQEIDDHLMHPSFDDEPEMDSKQGKAIKPEELTKDYWLAKGKELVQQRLNLVENTNRAKNIIFFIGDGLSHSTIGKLSILRIKFNNH
jgi:alkaline phosphatase